MKHTRPSEASQRSFSCQAMATATHISASAGRLNQRMFCRNSSHGRGRPAEMGLAQSARRARLPQQFQREKHPGGGQQSGAQRPCTTPRRRRPQSSRQPKYHINPGQPTATSAVSNAASSVGKKRQQLPRAAFSPISRMRAAKPQPPVQPGQKDAQRQAGNGRVPHGVGRQRPARRRARRPARPATTARRRPQRTSADADRRRAGDPQHPLVDVHGAALRLVDQLLLGVGQVHQLVEIGVVVVDQGVEVIALGLQRLADRRLQFGPIAALLGQVAGFCITACVC